MSVDAHADDVLPLEEIVARDPATALYLPLAERLIVQGRLEEAVHLCEERRMRPGRGVGDAIVLGRALLAQGRLEEARSEFAAALSLDRENVVALKALGGILSHQGNHEEAAGYYRAVCRVDPGDLESQTALHQITSGEFPEARPADVIVAQGGLTWQPIRLPREEEHLSELALGLHTIDSFGQSATAVPGASVGPAGAASVEAEEQRAAGGAPAPEPFRHREVAAERLDVEHSAPVPQSSAPGAPVGAPEVTLDSAALEPHAAPVEKLPPVAMPAPKAGALVEGNKNAFETWLRQLSGRDGNG
jgi:tetratricopeptide (TPR) repeat protein